jgi:hypothetical protein
MTWIAKNFSGKENEDYFSSGNPCLASDKYGMGVYFLH